MTRRDWIAAFAARAGIDDSREAERSARNVARELGGCLLWREAHNVADDLPEPLAGAIREGSFGTALARFSARAFVDRVAERDGVGPDVAERRAVALLSLLREGLPRSSVVSIDELLAAWRNGLAAIP